MACFKASGSSVHWRRAIQYQPVQSQIARGRRELIVVNRFTNVAVHGLLVRRETVAFLIGRGQDHHRQVLEVLSGANLLQDFQPTDAWKVQV